MSIFSDRLSTLVTKQNYPQSTLYVVATPIGNLADISLRALHVLNLVDVIACEDTRHSKILLDRYGINKPLLAAHEHNEMLAAQKIIQYLHQGARVALISDAGTPGIADPGARIVAKVRAENFSVVPLPGASAILSALAVAGELLFASQGAFTFIGFLPSKARQREAALHALLHHPYPLVLYEAPHRLHATLTALERCFPGQRQLLIGRELTKQFECFQQTSIAQASVWLATHAQQIQGEFVLIVEGADAGAASSLSIEADKLLALLLKEVGPATAAKVTAAITGVSRQTLYAQALALKESK